MTTINAFETIGRKQVDLENLHVEYGRVLGLIVEIQQGTLNPADLEIDMATRSWKRKAPEPRLAKGDDPPEGQEVA